LSNEQLRKLARYVDTLERLDGRLINEDAEPRDRGLTGQPNRIDDRDDPGTFARKRNERSDPCVLAAGARRGGEPKMKRSYRDSIRAALRLFKQRSIKRPVRGAGERRRKRRHVT
jgi:hypothetical protein